jgi:hypothetical protein
MTRLLVCGGRNFTNRRLLFTVLNNISIDHFGAIEVVIEGEARGADTLAREWAEENGIQVEPYPADWNRYGRAAGPIRNQQMLAFGKPTYAVAFFDRPRNESKGTADMVRRLEMAGVEVLQVGP